MYLKAVDPLGDVDGCQLHQLSELGVLVVSEEGEHWDDPLGVDQEFQLVTEGGGESE